MRRRTRALAGVLLSAVAVMGWADAAAAAKPGRPGGGGGKGNPPAVVGAEFNLSGWRQHRGALAPAMTVVERVRATTPTVVAVVETCSAPGGQWERLQAELAPLGYSFVWSPSIADLGFTACEQFGNGLAVRGAASNPVSVTYQAQRVSWDAAYQELRNIACTTFAAPDGQQLSACVTHLVNTTGGDHATTRAQAAEALTAVDAMAPGRRLVAGDFNLTPTDPALDRWYDGHREADSSRRTRKVQPTHDSGVKLDYVFGDVGSFGTTTTAAVEPVATSDHHWYLGTLPAA